LYTACYPRFAPRNELKSTPLYDFIELNRRQILLWGFDRGGPRQGQLLRCGARCIELQIRSHSSWRNVLHGNANVLPGEVFGVGAGW
jgi:hypothetical protein